MKIVSLLCVAVVAVARATATPAHKLSTQAKIEGGVNASISDFPHYLQLEYNGGLRCGASIYNVHTAVTAAQCVYGRLAANMTLRSGSDKHGSGGTIHQAVKLIPHPQYGAFSDNDVGLVIVDTPFNDNHAIPLVSTQPPVGSVVAFVGMGATFWGGSDSQNLQAIYLQVIEHRECEDAYVDMSPITEHMICSAAVVGDKGPCLGDNGGSLEYKGQLAGIFSWGGGCAQPTYPAVYSDVAALGPWIQDNAV